MSTMTCAFVNTDQYPLSVKHICYYATSSYKDGEKKIHLWEVVDETYPHPDVPENSVINVIKTHLIRTMKADNLNAAPIIILEAAEETVKILEKRIVPS